MPEHLLLPERIPLPSRRQGSAGGPGSPGRNPRRHGADLERQLQRAIAVGREIRVVEGVDPGLVFKVRATGRIEDRDWERRELMLLGDTADWTYFVLSVDDVPADLLRKLRRYEAGPDEEGGAAVGRTFFNALEDIRPYGRDDRRSLELPEDLPGLAEPLLVDVVVWPSANYDEAGRRLRQVRRVVEAFRGDQVAYDDRPRFTVLRARLSGEGVEALLGLAVVERVRLPPTPFIEPSDWTQVSADDLDRQIDDGEPIGVIDDGIADGHPLLADGGIASRRSFPPDHNWAVPGPHGTMVAGLAAFGDFEEPLRAGGPLVRRSAIHEARVLEPHPDIPNATQFAPTITPHQAIEQAIVALHEVEGIRVFNLSITDDFAYSGSHVSVWTERIDGLIRELGIIVVVSAGNRGAHQFRATMDGGGHAWADYPSYLLDPAARVAEPAAAALALSVGSVARSSAPQTLRGEARVGDRAIAEVNELSPFSRTGPGVYKTTKPDVVDFGGNWALNDRDILEPENPGVGVVSLALGPQGRLFRVSSGTSFAAPRVARLAADLWTAYPDASANLVRALVGIATRVPGPVASQFPDERQRLRAVGFGRPSAELALSSEGPRVVMYFDGEMDTDTVSIHPLPIPPRFARGRAQRRIAVSLAFDPPVRRQRREYMAGTMSFDLLRNVTPDEIRERYARQGATRVDLYDDRRRFDLRPGTRNTENSALQVRHASPRLLNPDDSDVYYLAVTHQKAPWAADGVQRYAVAVELVEEERVEVDLYAEVQQQVRVPARVRVRV